MPGDYPQLEKLFTTVNQFAGGKAQLTLGKAIANEALTQTLLSFRDSRDPYGNAWKPLKYRKGKPLLDTGRLRSSIAIRDVSATSFRIGTNVRYAGVHQDGYDGSYPRKARSMNMAVNARGKFASRKQARSQKTGSVTVRRLNYTARSIHMVIPARPFIPKGTLGPIWSKAFVAAGSAALLRILKQ